MPILSLERPSVRDNVIIQCDAVGMWLQPDGYARALHRQLAYLIAFARSINELDLAGALFGEFRGMQDAGWSTTQTAYEVFKEMRELGGQKEALSRPQYRQMLCLYTQLSEAGGVYESLTNLLGVIQLKPYNLWPFQDLVRVKQAPKRIIGPNANAMFRHLASLALAIGMKELSELLEITFRDDIRNGIAHADYIISADGLRLRRRNGGSAIVLPHDEVISAMNIGLMFFYLLGEALSSTMQTFRPAKRIIGRLSANPPMQWTVELQEGGAFSISGGSPGPQTDAAYDRQQAINNRLGGRVMMAYATEDHDTTLLASLQAFGFDVPLVVLNGADLSQLVTEIDNGGYGAHRVQAQATYCWQCLTDLFACQMRRSYERHCRR